MKVFAFLTAAALSVFALSNPAAADSPVVVELYTSEGCSSCPRADQYLFDLRERENVIALAFHVDYWDYLGWTDRFATSDFTNRQRAYARAMGSPMIYTPQLVVGGADHVVGSDRSSVDEAIAQAASRPPLIEIGLSWSEKRALTVSIPEASFDGDATIWFVRYGMEAESDVTSGENAGLTLVHANIVEELIAIGMWNGQAMEITLPWEAIAGGNGVHEFGCAIIVQPEGLGPILGAREISYDVEMSTW
jgi:hypothetical protein